MYCKGWFKHISLLEPLYLGGYLDYAKINRRASSGALSGYEGCVHTLKVNGRDLDMRTGDAFLGEAIYGVDTGIH